MQQIAVTAEFHFQADQVDIGLNILKALVIASRQDKGCMQYELYQSNDQPNTYIMMERWRSRQDWQYHINTDHVKSASAGISELLVDELTVNAYDLVM